MRRRTALQTIGATVLGTVAGCTQFDAQQSNSPSPEAGSPTTDSASGSSPSEPIPTDDFEFTATVLQQATAEHPARFRLTFTNTSESELSLSGGPTLPFSAIRGEQQDGDARLLLIPDERDWITPTGEGGNVLDVPLIPRSQTDGCWTAEYDGTLRKQTSLHTQVSPGETVSHEYTLLNWATDSCLPAGTWTFTDEQVVSWEDQAAEFEASFEISVHRGSDETVAVDVPEPTVRKHTQ
ncbi:hypothetical protein SAMN04488691_101176 [Haloferax larsenii]|uniref:Lipoprotein n=2 Tax=Haloferax larsenii TaxID=302484 RepID=A0A1H7G0E9_HALLR|nr:hypothetical protein SAMN04488691_101176 [Haloferax larsenii]